MDFYNASGVHSTGTKKEVAQTVVSSSSVSNAVIEELKDRISELEKANSALSSKISSLTLKLYTKDETDFLLKNASVEFESGANSRSVYSQATINRMINNATTSSKTYAQEIVDTSFADYNSKLEAMSTKINESISKNENYFEWYSPVISTDPNKTVYSAASLKDYTAKYGVYSSNYLNTPQSNQVYNAAYINELINSTSTKIGNLTLQTTDDNTLVGLNKIKGPITIDGDLIVNGVISQISDEKQKENIKKLNPISSLMSVLKMKPISYKLHGQNEYGLSVQQMNAVEPICVKNNQTLNYTSLIPLLINSIKVLVLLMVALGLGILVILVSDTM